MKNIISSMFRDLADNLDSGGSELAFEDQCKIIHAVNGILHKEVKLNKQDSASYIGVSRSTFDNYINSGYIPKGNKDEGFNNLYWYVTDLALAKIKLEEAGILSK